jgi:hypothetical protein
MRDGNLKAAEAALAKLLKRERFMRLDGQAIAVALYGKLGETEKARKHREFLEGLSSAVFAAGLGTSFEKPIEVLFIEEEYVFLATMGLKLREQALSERDGHRFDLITTHASGDKPERTFYFNIDMPWNSLQADMKQAVEWYEDFVGKK